MTKINVDLTGTRHKAIIGTAMGDMDRNVFSLPLNIVPEFTNIRHVRITITKLLGGENRGTAGVFGKEGGVSQFVSKAGPGEDISGWSPMQFNANGNDNIGTASGTIAGEIGVSDTIYAAQRFQVTQSAGRFMFRFRGRLPSGAPLGNQLLFSIWDDQNTGDVLDPAPFKPNKPLVGTQDVQQVKGWFIFSDSPFGTTLKNTTQGWVSIPFSMLPQIGSNSSATTTSALCAIEVETQNIIPPNTNLWLVMRLNSAGAGTNFWVGAGDNGGGANASSYEFLKSTDAGASWSKFNTPANQFVLGIAKYYGNAPVSSIGGWQPSGGIHYPGTTGITSAATGQAILNLPILDDKNGMRLDVTRVVKNSGEGDVNGTTTGSGVYSIEPVTGEHYPAISVPGENNQHATISFPTSIVALRDTYQDVFVAFPASTGSYPSPSGAAPNEPIRRMDYILQLQYNDF